MSESPGRRRQPNRRVRTGCSSCKRRKVRCDESKPICAACTRLSLKCSYEPSNAGEVPATPQYRLRFVDSPYSNLLPEENKRSISDSPPVETPPRREADEVVQEITASEEHARQLRSHVIETTSRYDAVTDEQNSHDANNDTNPRVASIRGAEEPDSGHNAADGTGHVPFFFDLNMNFDLLSEEWLTPPGTIEGGDIPDSALVQTENSNSPQDARAVIIDPDDHLLIQHYLNVMTRYSKIRGSGDENLYAEIFSNMALFYAPLMNAILAWTALHIGQSKGQSDMTQKAEERYLHAVSLMYRDQDVAQHSELALLTIWFALQFELLAARGTDRFCGHLDFAADLIDVHRRHPGVGRAPAPFGRIGSRVLVWLGAYDVRASYFGGGRLLQNLELFFSDFDFLETAFPDPLASNGPADLRPCLRMNMELDLAEGRIVRLHRRPNMAPIAMWSAVQSDLQSIGERLEANLAVAQVISAVSVPNRQLSEKITTSRFNCVLLLASYYSTVISYHRLIPASMVMKLPGKIVPAETAAIRIIRLASWVCRCRSPSPQNIWPRILFLAGIETVDSVYQDWVLKTLSEAGPWGVNFSKTKDLLVHVIKKQNREGVRADYLEVMRQKTGLFII